MANDNDSNQRFRHKVPIRVIATHKFPIGCSVLHRHGARSADGLFRVVRQLPDEGAGLQYRIKRDHDGRECVATESTLQRGTKTDFTA